MAKISKIEIDGLSYDLQDLETSEKLENEITRATEMEQDLLDKWDGLINSPESIIPIKTVNGEDLIGTGNIEIIGERGEKGDKGEKGEQGEPGITSATVSVDNTIGTPSATATITGQVLDIKFKGLKGEQGNSGYTGAVDELEIVNNLTQGGATSALSAEMGKELAQMIEDATDDELTGRVDNLENKVYGIKEVSGVIITQNDFKEEDANIIQDNTRGVIYWSVEDLPLFESATLTVKTGVSNLKVAMHSTNTPLVWNSYISDTGWITAGNTKTIDKTFVEGESYFRLAWTNSGGTAVPSLETLVSSIEFTLDAQGSVYNYGLTNQVNDISTMVSDLSETTATLKETVYGVEQSTEEIIDVTSLPEKVGSLGSDGTWYAQVNASHKAVPVSGRLGLAKISFTSSQLGANSYVAFVTNSYTGAVIAGGKVPFAGGATNRTVVPENTITELEIPSDAAYLILTTVDGAGYVSTWNCELLYENFYIGLIPRIDSVETQVGDNTSRISQIENELDGCVRTGVKLTPTLISGTVINSFNGVASNSAYELVDYLDISELNTVHILTGLWISSDSKYDTVIELYNSSKSIIKRYLARELYGSAPSAFAFVYDNELDVSGAYYIRFSNIVSTPSNNTNPDFTPVEVIIRNPWTPIPSSQVVDESLNKTQDEINAEIGSLQSTIFGTTSVGVTDTITQENITEDTYTSTTAGSGRGMFVFPISQYDIYTFSVSVAADSTIKACIHLKNSKGWSDNFYDGGWIVAGKSQSITNAQDKYREAPFAGLGFTYISTNAGIPTIEEIQQYVTIEFVGSIFADKGLVGRVDNLEKAVFPSTVGYSYQGEKVSFVDNGFTSEIIGNLSAGVSSRQGGAIYGDYLFQFHNTLQTIVVYNLKSGKNVQTLNLTPISNHHAGSGGFSNEFYDSADQFPILYISSMYENRIYGYRISGTEEGTWTIETVRTITLDIEGLFIPNITVDRENNMIVAFGYTRNSWSDESNNLSVITSFVIPTLSSGDVTITTEDCSDMRKIPFIYAEQGAFARLGKLYLSYGNTISKCGMFVIDYISGIAVSHAPFEPLGNFEPEAFALYNGNIIMTDQNGKIYKLTF